MNYELDRKERSRLALLEYCAIRDRTGRHSSEAIAARNALVAPHRGLVIDVARRYRCRSLELGDLIAYGIIGLINAIERFDPARECSLATIARWWVRHEIGRAVADLDSVVRIPVHVQQLQDPETRESCARARAALSLDAPLTDDGSRTLSESIPNPESPDPYECVSAKQARELLAEAIRDLPPTQRAYAHAWMREEMPSEACRIEVIGKERGRQLERQALQSLALQLSQLDEISEV